MDGEPGGGQLRGLVDERQNQVQSLPESFLRWQIESRRALVELIAADRYPRRFPAHLPVMITFGSDAPFPIRTATKGAGLTPRDDALLRYITLYEETLARCQDRTWEETLPEKAAAIRVLLDHPEDLDPRRLGFLEIFRGGTFINLQRDPRVVLHFTGDGPEYPSFQINGYAQVLDPEDRRYRFLALSRALFEGAPFHIRQPGYVCAYLVWVSEVVDKKPYPVAPSHPYHHHPVPRMPSEGKRPEETAAEPIAAGSLQAAVNFGKIFVAIDNSPHSAWALEVALQVAAHFRSTVVGSHAYAARLHDRRFRDMEPGLPERYQDAQFLVRERQVHDSLITRGLELISDSYLKPLEQRCDEMGLTFIPRLVEGKNYAQLVREIHGSGYDLVVMGARGLGEVEQPPPMLAPLGSVCERVVRRVTRDVLVVKNDRRLGGLFVVGIDGSPRSFAALRVALTLAGVCAARVQAIAAYDPAFHKVVLGALKGALTAEAEQVFKTHQQEKLHDELIDGGIAKIYADHLETACRIAVEAGHEIETRLLAGKPHLAVLRCVEEEQPTLLALGRTGIHADENLDIGSNAERLLRLAPCHVLLVGRSTCGFL